MPGKPGFTRVLLMGGTLKVCGGSVEDEHPYQIHVTILQKLDGQGEPRVAVTTLKSPTTDWEADFDAEKMGFTKGDCVVVGHEVQLDPQFSTHTWVQYMEIK